MRNAQVYLRCILGGKSLEPPVFTLESGQVTKVTFIRCHLQCYAPRRWGHINSKCRTHQFLMSDTSIRGIGSTRFVCGIGSTRFICSIGSTRFFVASVRRGLFVWHRFDTVCLCGIGWTRFIRGIGSTRFVCGIGSTRFKTEKEWASASFRADRAIPIQNRAAP